ncbi:hypothetical protein EIP91_004121 [Steccherinum ochraceum]|uniref:Uncharacterized protein n=1 Tax=Steccherinum ochraceum TaxID=92696 RepID=A0A4R0RFK8_9APHY|nr:hypothetical protein EIP91_004121 [Steccherinum ochraceum]
MGAATRRSGPLASNGASMGVSVVPFYVLFVFEHPFRCKATLISDIILGLLGLLGTAAFSTLRIWAIWGHSLIPTLAVLLTSAVVPAINIYTISQVTSFTIIDGNCVNEARYSATLFMRISQLKETEWPIHPVGYAARSGAIASDLLVLVLTWMRTADVWRESRRIENFKPTISLLLLRDGTWYFMMHLAMNIVALLLDTFQARNVGGDEFIVTLSAVSANLLARFMLDLRGINEHGSSRPRTVSSVNFNIASLGGNVGAPLGVEDSTWASGPTDDVVNERGHQYEETAVAFHAGLGLDKRETPSLRNVPSTYGEVLDDDLVGTIANGRPSTSDLRIAPRNCETELANA